MVELKDLQLPDGVKDRDLISEVREIYPKYDKYLHSKCKRPGYGITLRRDALKAIIIKYASEPLGGPQSAKRDGHRFTRRISCRLPDEVYDQLQLHIRDDGYQTMQDWLSDHVRAYLKFKERIISRESTKNSKRQVSGQV